MSLISLSRTFVADVNKRKLKLGQSYIFTLPFGLSGFLFPNILVSPDDESFAGLVVAGQVPREAVVVAPPMLVVRSGRMPPVSFPLTHDAGVGSAAGDRPFYGFLKMPLNMPFGGPLAGGRTAPVPSDVADSTPTMTSAGADDDAASGIAAAGGGARGSTDGGARTEADRPLPGNRTSLSFPNATLDLFCVADPTPPAPVGGADVAPDPDFPLFLPAFVSILYLCPAITCFGFPSLIFFVIFFVGPAITRFGSPSLSFLYSLFFDLLVFSCCHSFLGLTREYRSLTAAKGMFPSFPFLFGLLSTISRAWAEQ